MLDSSTTSDSRYFSKSSLRKLSIAAVALVNAVKVRTAALLAERGALPPVLTSAAIVGAEESARLFDAAYAEHARRAAQVLRGAGRASGGEPAR